MQASTFSFERLSARNLQRGGVTALEKLGFRNGFKTLIGISTGAPVISYFAAGQSALGTSIYYEENISNNFINFNKIFRRGKQIVDINFICDIFRGKVKNKKINLDSFYKNNSDIFYVLTNEKTGNPYFLNAKAVYDPIEGIRASAAIPVLYSDDVVISGRKYVDGAVAGDFPIKKILKEVKPTSILIFANRHKTFVTPFLEKLFIYYASIGKSVGFKNSFKNSELNFKINLNFLQKSKLPYVIIWTDNKVGTFEQNAKKLKAAANRFEKFVFKLLK